MSKILEQILSKPIEHLVISRKVPPNKEALRLYRGEIIRKSSRKEFDVARNESDHLIAMKMIMTSREALQKTKEKNLPPQFKSTIDNSLGWRIWHGLNYMNGGLTFFVGSMLYYQIFNNATLAGWLYTIGSTTFLLADLTEWNHYRISCFGSQSEDYLYNYKDNMGEKLQKAEVGLNFFYSAIGSLLYLIGSICFIPSTQLLTYGEWLFIVGSLVIFLSQIWKCYRTATTNEYDNSDNKFKLKNIQAEMSGFLVDFLAGLGGLFYFIGTSFFSLEDNPTQMITGINLFVCGGISFTLSGFAMQYRYFVSKKQEEYAIQK